MTIAEGCARAEAADVRKIRVALMLAGRGLARIVRPRYYRSMGKQNRRILMALSVACLLGGCLGVRPPKRVEPAEKVMKVTGYCKCGQCCGWHRTWYGRPVFSSGRNKGKRKPVGVTASGRRARSGTIAADTSRYPFGTVMYIPGYGYGRVEDRGGQVKGEHIDLYFRSHRQAAEWGLRNLRVKVWRAE